MSNFRALIPGGFFADGTLGPVAIRANNPGAINGATWEKSWPGFVGNVKYDGVNDTTVFEAPEYGVSAWWNLMRLYRAGGTVTVGAIVDRYGGGQDYSAYARTVSLWSGLLPGYEIIIDGSDDDNLLNFAKAMFRYEAGQPTPLSDAQILYGFKIGRLGGKLPPLPDDVGAGLKPAPTKSATGLGDAELARRIVAAMDAKGVTVDRGTGELNIVYVEGLNLDGTANDNAIDKWNDLRCVVGFTAAVGAGFKPAPTLLFKCDATTEPGIYYDRTNPIGGPQGAALITLGQQRCWRIGWHSPGGGHEALIQTGGAVSVYRDFDRSFRRQEGHITTGWYGINQHGTREGFDGSPSSVATWSAGCLVARRFADHKAFMALVKSDPRYIADKQYVFATTVLSAAEVLAAAPSKSPPAEPPQQPPVVITQDDPAPPRRDLTIGAGVAAAFAGLAHLAGAHPLISIAVAIAAVAVIFAVLNWLHK